MKTTSAFGTIVLLFVILFDFVLTEKLSAQLYVEGGNTRHRFAQMYIGAEGFYQPGWNGVTKRVGEDGAMEIVQMGDRIAPRLTIGGTHFWGHADFYVAFNVLPQSSTVQGLQHGFQLGVETGARVYPWRIEKDALRPFVGLSWTSSTYSQAVAGAGESGRGAIVRLDRAVLETGVAYQTGDIIWEAGAKWIPDNTTTYWISRTDAASITLPNTAFRLGAKYVFDTTIGEELREQEKPGYLARREEVYREQNRLNTWTVAAGPSSAVALQASPHTLQNLPFANPISAANRVALDFGIGYFFYDLNAHLNVSYRPMTGSHAAFGVRQELNRHAVSLEAYKFFGDYQGFVPFVGATFGYESLQYKETEGERVRVEEQAGKWLPGVIFGWDIRPTTTDAWLLRTNLRYTPGASLSVKGQEVIFPNFEFNFIQLIINLNRFF